MVICLRPYKYEPKINSGDLRHRIEIWENKRTKNELGETTYEWKKINKIWASVVPQTGKMQSQQAETILTNVTHKIIIRYSAEPNITKDMQIFHRDHQYEIEYILNPYERDETLEIFCKEELE